MSDLPVVGRLFGNTRRQAQRYALLHWRFFDRFVSADTGWLAPDNYQEDGDTPALSGWRRELFGEDALRLVRGELALAVRNRKIATLPTEA